MTMAENKKAQDLIKYLEDLFAKLPNLPKGGREGLVKIAPWLALIFGILGVLGGLSAIGFSPLALFVGVSASFNVLISGVAAIIASVLLLMAYPKLSKHAYKGWELLFWSEIVNAVGALLSISASNVLGIVLGIGLGFYLIFQIKSYYK